jgi:hypothetical protein
VRKDLNFLRDTNMVIKMNQDMKDEFMRRLYNDKEFLKSCNLMDYSLLLIIFQRRKKGDEEQFSASKKEVGMSIDKESSKRSHLGLRSVDFTGLNIKKGISLMNS